MSDRGRTVDAASVEVRLPLPSGVTLTGFAVAPASGTSGPVAHYTADDGILRSWDVDAGTHRQVGLVDRPLRSGIVLAPGGRAVSRVDDDTVASWHLGSGEVEHVFVVPPNPGSGWRYPVNGWDVDARGRLAVASRDKQVRVWDVDGGALLHDMRRFDDPYFSNAFTVTWVDEDHVVTWEERSAIRLWSVSTGEVVASWSAAMDRLEVTGAGRLVHASRGTLALIDLRRRRPKKVSGSAGVRTFCVLGGDRAVAVGDRGVELWDLGSARLLGALPVGLPPWFRTSDPWPDPAPTYLCPVSTDSVVSVGTTGVGARWFPHRFTAPADLPAPTTPSAPDRSGLAMDVATFWSLVETSRRRAQGRADGDVDLAQTEALTELLASRTREELVAFHRHFRDRIDDADTEKMLYAATDEIGGMSDDGFLYFRCWLVGLGRRSFESVVGRPSRLARLLRRHPSSGWENFELFGAVYDVWEERFDGELPVVEG